MGDWLQDRCNEIQKAQQEHIQKSFSEDIEKARSGVYKPTKQNLKEGKAGQKYGSEKKEELTMFKIGDKVKLEDGYDSNGKKIIREYTITKPGMRSGSDRLKENEFYLTAPGTMGFDASVEWLKKNVIK